MSAIKTPCFLFVPSDDFNSKSYLVSRFLFKSGDRVEKNQLLSIVETSKKVIEIEAPVAGYFYYVLSEGDEVNIQKALGVVSMVLLNDNEVKKIFEVKESNSDLQISAKAKKYLDKYNIDQANFKNLEVIKIEDVKKFLKETYNIESVDYESHRVLIEESLSPNMFTSYISTPFSYEKLLAKQNKKSADLKKNISTDVLFVYYVHESLKVFDKLSSYIDESDLVKMNNFPVGIYISDINKSGVSYVLLKDQLNDMDITADKIYEIYKAFVTGTVYGNKSMHSAIYISNMMNLNVSSFVPLLKKRTCATLAISSPDAAGSYNVGLTFDHRIMEGAYVASFLSDLKMRIEK